MHLVFQLLLTAVVTIAGYGLVTLGFSLVFSVNRVLHFAHGGTILVPGYVYHSVSGRLPFVPALAVALVGGVVVVLAIELGIYWQMQKRNAASLTLLAASIGLLSLVEGVVGAVWGTTPIYLHLPVPSGSFNVGSLRINDLDATLVVVAIVVIGAVLPWIGRSRTGRTLLAVAEERNVALTVGISELRARLITQTLGVCVSSLAVIYLGARVGLTPAMGVIPLLYAFGGSVVGGLGRIGGSIVGVAVIVAISTFATAQLPTFWTLPFAFVVLALFLLIRPTGIFGLPRRSTAL